MKSPLRLATRVLRKIIPRLNPLTVDFDSARKHFSRSEVEDRQIVANVFRFNSFGEAVFDVGANCGFWSRYLLEGGYRGRLILFEPIPNLMSIAVRNLAEYSVEKIFLNSALGSVGGEITIALPTDGNIGWVTPVIERSDMGSQKIVVSSVATDDFVKMFKPGFVKIDVEGFEAVILGRFLKLINPSYMPVFLVELGWGVSNPYWTSAVDIFQKLSSFGYAFYDAKSLQKISLDVIIGLSQTLDVFISPVQPGAKA